MNHPEPNEWLAYLDGESSPDIARQLAQHLKECTICAAELAAWRRSAHRLQTWKWPTLRASHRAMVPLALKWGLAALLVLGLGFSLGRFAAPSERELRTSLAGQLRTELRQELQADLMAVLADANQPAATEFQQQLREDFKVALARVTSTDAGQERQTAQDMLETVQRYRQEDRRDVVALFDQLQQLAGGSLALRKDLENLATTADARLQQTRWQLNQLAADTRPETNKQ